MGTRADFYVKEKGRELTAEDWIGSIALDGYPEGIPKPVKWAKTAEDFKEAVIVFAKDREDFTYPKDGWPWPWETSELTEYAYVFDCETCKVTHKEMPYPDMSKIQKVTLGERSGVTIIGVKQDGSVGIRDDLK